MDLASVSASETADFFEVHEGEARTLRFVGPMVLAALGDMPVKLDNLPPGPVVADLSEVERMDTVGAWVVHRLVRDYGGRVVGVSGDMGALLEQVAEADRPVEVRPQHGPPLERMFARVGHSTWIAAQTLFGLIGFFGSLILTFGRVVAHPSRLRVHEIVQRIEVVGVHALGIIGLMSFLVGIVIAQQGAVQLRQFGAEVFTINLIGRSAVKELGVLMTAIMVAGRSGSAFAAQLGSMKITEEVDAMRTIGVSPMEALVLPRVLATLLTMPLLSFYAAICALIGGGLFVWLSLDIPPITFVQRIREVVPITDLWGSLIKAVVFGTIIALAGCFQGLQVKSNAEEVGLRTTAAVVQGIFLVIVLDAFFAVFFTEIGWI
ncbi:MAG: MlaE family ABC transporter permease [Sphingomonadaceae bacterium]